MGSDFVGLNDLRTVTWQWRDRRLFSAPKGDTPPEGSKGNLGMKLRRSKSEEPVEKRSKKSRKLLGLIVGLVLVAVGVVVSQSGSST